MGGDRNTVKVISKDSVDQWPELSKQQVANRLLEKIIAHFNVEVLEA